MADGIVDAIPSAEPSFTAEDLRKLFEPLKASRSGSETLDLLLDGVTRRPAWAIALEGAAHGRATSAAAEDPVVLALLAAEPQVATLACEYGDIFHLREAAQW